MLLSRFHWCPVCGSYYEGDEDKCSLWSGDRQLSALRGKGAKTANFCPVCAKRLFYPCPDCWIMGGEYDCGRKRCPWWLRLMNKNKSTSTIGGDKLGKY